jgi:hypothetical protein
MGGDPSSMSRLWWFHRTVSGAFQPESCSSGQPFQSFSNGHMHAFPMATVGGGYEKQIRKADQADNRSGRCCGCDGGIQSGNDACG